jgi:hypothetical protein
VHEQNLRTLAECIYESDINSSDNARIILDSRPENISINDAKGNILAKRSLTWLAEWLSTVMVFTITEKLFDEQFLTPVRLVSKYILSIRDTCQSTTELKGIVVSTSPPHFKKNFNEKIVNITIIAPELETSFNLRSHAGLASELKFGNIALSNVLPVPFINRIHPTKAQKLITSPDKSMKLAELHFLKTSIADLENISQSLAVENMFEYWSSQTRLNRLGTMAVIPARVVSSRPPNIILGSYLFREKSIRCLVTSRCLSNMGIDQNTLENYEGKDVLALCIIPYLNNPKASAKPEPEIFYLENADDQQRQRNDEGLGLLRLRRIMKLNELKSLGIEADAFLGVSNVLEKNDRLEWVQARKTSECVKKTFLNTKYELRNLRTNMEYNEPSILVLPAEVLDYDKLNVKHLAGMLNKDTKLSDCLLKLIEQSDLYISIPSRMAKLAEFFPSLDKSTLRSKIHFLRFLGLMDKRKDSMVVTELGISVASVSKSRAIEAMIFDRARSTDGRLLTILDIEASGLPESVIFRTIDRLHDEGKLHYPAINGVEFKLLWVTESPDLDNPDVNKEILKRSNDLSSHVLNALSRVSYPLSEAIIVKELRGKDLPIGKETVYHLTKLLSSTHRITKKENQWFYPYENRLEDLLNSRPHETLTVDEMMKDWGVPDWNKSIIKDVINNAEKEGRITRIAADRWVSGAIDKNEQLATICSQLVLDKLKSSEGPIPKSNMDYLLRQRLHQFFSEANYMPENPGNFTERVLSDLIKSGRIVLDAKGIGRGVFFQ